MHTTCVLENAFDVKLRFLCSDDIDTIKKLCNEWFPIKYPDNWYEEIASANNKFYSIVATVDNQIVGLLIAEIKLYLKCNYEDLGLLCKSLEKTSRVAYILTLGVIRPLRRHGVATILVKMLIENMNTNPLMKDCKAIYLHVLTTNTVAIEFYKKLMFQRFKLLPLYYSINNCACDGYSYVLYTNGGKAPCFCCWSLLNSKYPHFIVKFIYTNTIKCFFHKCFFIKNISKNLINLLFLPFKYAKTFVQYFLYSIFCQSSNSKNNLKKNNLYIC